MSAFETEFFISGLAPLADQLVTLFFVKDHMVIILLLLSFYTLPTLLGTHVQSNVVIIKCILMLGISEVKVKGAVVLDYVILRAFCSLLVFAQDIIGVIKVDILSDHMFELH